MDDSSHTSGLYRWKRQTDSKVYSRSQKIATTNAVEDWVKKVELASTRAVAEVFGGNGGYGVGRDRGRVRALQTTQQLREHDNTHAEAQELLSQWMSEKVRLDDDLDNEFTEESWNKRSNLEAEVKREWDHLLDNNQVDCGDQSWRHRHKVKDPYADLYEMEEKEAVNTILHNLMEKEVIKDSFFKTLSQEETAKHRDPRMKMDLRQKQVKENREKRQTEVERRRRDQQTKKTAQFEAKQILLKEEREKSQRIKREEMEVQKEMASIRKDMQDEKRRTDELKQRERRDRDRTEVLAREEMERQLEEESRERDESQRTELRRRDFLRKMEQLQRRQAAVNLKVLQRHFSAWYTVVLKRRMKLGKAEALSDWKCLLKGWNAWKSYVRDHRLDRETQRYQTVVKDTYRKSHMAEDHHRRTLLRKYFLSWQIWVHQEQDRKELKQAQSKTRNKMMAFLEAAATGKLWDGEAEGTRTDKQDRGDGSNRPDSARRKVDEMFAEPTHRRAASLSGASSARSSITVNGSSSARKAKAQPLNPRIPTEAWQVTKRHLNLSPDEIASLGNPPGGDTEEEGLGDQPDAMKSRKRLKKVPWNIPQMPVNNFEHRHKAQQQILEEQQKQLKEQKRLIEELQFEQQIQTLQTQAEKQHLTQELLNNINNIESTTEPVLLRNQQITCAVNRKEKIMTDGGTATDEPGSQPNSSRSGATPVIPHSARSEASQTPSSVSNAITSKSSTKYVTVLKKMEDRASERARMKADREEKKRKAEEERLTQLQAQEEEILQRQEKEKRVRVEAYREKKRAEKLREQDRLQQVERLRQLNIMAEQHFEKSLLKYRGILPMKRLVDMAYRKTETAEQHYNECILRKTFVSWHTYVRDMLKAKHSMVDEMHKYFVVRRCFSNWKNYKNIMALLERKAQRFYAKTLQCKVLQAWADRAADEKVTGWEKERRAKQHNEWRMLRNTFMMWRQYPEYVRKEKEREKRKAEMRQKVASLLPDYDSSSTPRNSIQHV